MSKRDNEGVKVDAVTSGVVVTVAAAVAEWLNELMAVTAVVEAVAAAAVASKGTTSRILQGAVKHLSASYEESSDAIITVIISLNRMVYIPSCGTSLSDFHA